MCKIFLASDLDRTLIYSKKFISEVDINKIETIEYKENNPLSYMSKSAKEELNRLIFEKKLIFIPVTTRSNEQFRRVKISKNIKYAITFNGGCILKYGEKDKKWDQIIKKRLNYESAFREDIFRIFIELKEKEIFLRIYMANEYFVYAILNPKIDANKLKNHWSSYFNKLGWTLYFSYTKVYCIPYFLTKDLALKEIIEREKIKTCISSGDTIMDFCMAKVSDEFLLPAHAQKSEVINDFKFKKFKTEGIFFSNEIINYIKEKYL